MRALKAIGLTAMVIAVHAFTAHASRAQEKAQDWPNRPVRVVVPFGAGGAADRLGRIAADHLSKAFKQQFYIENRVGAGGAVASKDIVRARSSRGACRPARGRLPEAMCARMSPTRRRRVL